MKGSLILLVLFGLVVSCSAHGVEKQEMRSAVPTGAPR